MGLHAKNGSWRVSPAVLQTANKAHAVLTLKLLSFLAVTPVSHVLAAHVVALVLRALHQLYLVFAILGQGQIKPGWKADKTALEMGPSCSTGAAGAVQPCVLTFVSKLYHCIHQLCSGSFGV